MPKAKQDRITVRPNILILEGLWDDTSKAVEAAGGIATESHPWDYNEVEDALWSGRYQGVILTGGSDICPALYTDDPPHNQVYGIDHLRDEVEMNALKIARALELPVLGICRGSQIMCAFRGGELTQHIEEHRGRDHYVFATPEARTFKRAANSRDMRVISLHHQCVSKPGLGMRIAALADDGTPEAIESKDGLWLGVQFHPELNALSNANSFGIFRWLVSKGAEHLGGRAPTRYFRHVKRTGHCPPQRQGTLALDPGSSSCMPRAATPAEHDAANREESGAGSTAAIGLPPRRSRKAGDPSIPSLRCDDVPTIREMTRLIEESTGGPVYLDATAEEIEDRYDELDICPHCAMLFDDRADRDDHISALHADKYGTPFDGAESRYPELEPPPGHPAWQDDDEADQLNAWLRGHPTLH